MATITELEKRLMAVEAAIEDLSARPDPTDQEARIVGMEAKIEALKDRPDPTDQAEEIEALKERVAALEAAGKNRVEFNADLKENETPPPDLFKAVGDFLTDKFGRWFHRTEQGVELFREDYVVDHE